jgi:hypothetical protein
LSAEPEQSHLSSRKALRLRQTREKEKKNRVVTYLAILFGAAFLLLLMASLMQDRAHRQTISDLTQTVNSVHSLQDLLEVNQSLAEENQALKAEQEALREQKETSEAEKAALETALLAMDWFWQVDEAFVRGRYALCRELIEKMEAHGLVETLPKESGTDTGRFSPADRFQEIRDNLF